jgi:ribose 5-phosphate isomerase
MLRAGTGMRTKNDISITEAEKLVRKLGGEYAPVEILKTKKRNAGREALSVLLTMYLQKPISIAQAARCFHNPTNR